MSAGLTEVYIRAGLCTGMYEKNTKIKKGKKRNRIYCGSGIKSV